MKQNKLLFLSAAIVLMAGCKEKIELDKVDSSMSVNTGIAAPIVTIKAPLSEMLGIDDKTGHSNQLEWMYAKMPGDKNEQLKDLADSTLFFCDTFNITRDFHPINISGFILPLEQKLNIYEQAKTLKHPVTDGKINIPAASPAKFSFPLTVKLDSLNSPEFDNRVDIMRISKAQFSTNLTTNFGLKDADIQSVKLKMPKEFRTLKGNDMNDVYLPFHVEGETTYINLKRFLINMQSEGVTPSTRRDHMINELTFNIEFSLFTTHPLVVDASSVIDYTFNVELLTFEALWGYFDPSTWMEDKDTLILAEEWPAWNDIKDLKMHFKYPSIRLIAEHQIGTEEGCPLNVNLKHIGVAPMKEDGTFSEDDFVYAMFGDNGDQKSTIWRLYDQDYPTTTRIDPINDDYDKWSKNEYIVGYQNYKPGTHVGDVDKMFDIRPDVIRYEYDITVGPKNNLSIGKASQLRVVNNTKIDLHAVTVVPFVFDEGSSIGYNDTIDVDFSSVNFDSITNSVKWLDSINSGVIYLYLFAKNSIPFKISGDYLFLDENGQTIDLPLVDGESGVKSYHLEIPAPKEYDANGNVTKTGDNTIVLRVTHEEFNKLQSIKQIVFAAKIEGNPNSATISMSSGLDVKVGVAATIDAVLKLF
ncbi:MAG: hypothetical protein K5660_09225 [Paludibacteraceae bacterium]|nr:hypothetical protein [Paludibacteraceae bacterium]